MESIELSEISLTSSATVSLAALTADIEKMLRRDLGLKVKISTASNGSGKIVLSYADLAELDRILDILNNSRKNQNA